MKRFWLSVATFSLAGWIGRHPATAGALMLLGIGGGVSGIASLITPTITPKAAAYFNQNQAFGPTNNGLLPNAGTIGAFEVPTNVTASFVVPFEITIDPHLGYGLISEDALNSGTSGGATGLQIIGNNASKPFFTYKELLSGSDVWGVVERR